MTAQKNILKSNRSSADYFELLVCQFICHKYKITFSYSKDIKKILNKILILPNGKERILRQNKNFEKVEKRILEILNFEIREKGKIIDVEWVGRNFKIKQTTSDVDTKHKKNLYKKECIVLFMGIYKISNNYDEYLDNKIETFSNLVKKSVPPGWINLKKGEEPPKGYRLHVGSRGGFWGIPEISGIKSQSHNFNLTEKKNINSIEADINNIYNILPGVTRNLNEYLSTTKKNKYFDYLIKKIDELMSKEKNTNEKIVVYRKIKEKYFDKIKQIKGDLYFLGNRYNFASKKDNKYEGKTIILNVKQKTKYLYFGKKKLLNTNNKNDILLDRKLKYKYSKEENGIIYIDVENV